MSDDVDGKAQATLDLTQALAALRTLTSGMQTLQNATVSLNQAQQQYSNHATKGFKEVGNLVGKIPGMSGLHDMFKEAENGSALFARLGVGVAVLSAAYAAYNAVIDTNIQRMRLLISASNEYYEIAEKTKALQDSQAKAGLGQNTPAYRKAFALGGQGALDDATMLENTGNFSHDEAIKAVGTLAARMGGARGKAYNGALGGLIDGSKVGLGLDEMLTAYSQRGQGMGIPGAAGRLNAFLATKDMSYSGYGVSVPDTYKAMLARANGDPAQVAAAAAGKIGSVIPIAQRQTAIDLGTRQAGGAAAEALNPGMAMMTAHYRAQERQWTQEQLIANEERGFRQWMKDSWIALLMGGQGSLQHQLNMKKNAEGNALFGDTPGAAPYQGAPTNGGEHGGGASW